MKTPKILCLVTLAALFLMMAQGQWHFIPMRSLKGASTMPDFPRPYKETVMDGSWQGQMDKYAKYNFGFREPAIRLYNQYIWSCYHKTLNQGVIPGRNNYLYERYFVEDHYESRMYKYTSDPQELRDKFDLEARRLAQLQELLREHGTTLFVAILPGKDYVYPEFLPPQDTMRRTPGPRAYPEYLRLFEQYGVNYVDVLDWFLGIKDTVAYDLMPPLGTHWSNIAATYAFDSIMRYMQHLGGPAIRGVQLGKPYIDKDREPDNDLGLLLNLTVPPRQKACQYVDVTLAPETDTAHLKPGLIVLGDSFFWNIHYNFPLDSLFRYTHYWFYFNTIYFDTEHDNTSQIDLRQALIDADYVMLSYCSGQLYDLGNNFIGKALVELCYTDEEIQAVRDSLCNNIRRDEHWRQYVQNKAASEGISLDQAILNDANYLINTRPEEYFEKLRIGRCPADNN